MNESVKTIAMEYVETTKELDHVQWYLRFAQKLNAMFVCAREHTAQSCKRVFSHIEDMLTSLSHFSTADISDDAYPFVSETFYALQSSGLPSRKPPHVPFSEMISIFSMHLSLARDYAVFLVERRDLLELLRLLPSLSLQPLPPSFRSLLCSCFRGTQGNWRQMIESLFRGAHLSDRVGSSRSNDALETAGRVGSSVT